MTSHKFFILTVFCFLAFSCTSTGNAKKENQIINDGQDQKSITIINGIINQFTAGNAEAAWARMSDEYKVAVSEKTFISAWETAVLDKGGFLEAKVSKLSSSIYYSRFKADLSFENGTVPLIFVTARNSNFPVDLKYVNNSTLETFETYTQEEALNDSLAQLCGAYFKLGCGITGASPNISAVRVPQFMEIAKTQFSSATSTNLMKPSYLLQQNESIKNYEKGNGEPVLNYAACDPLLEWAYKNGKQIRGHTLVWHVQIPDWFFKEGYKSDGALVNRDVMKFRMESYIRQYVTHVQEKFPGVVYCWDVVNEAITPGSGDHNTNFECRIYDNENKNPNLWYSTLGADYVELAFTYARKYVTPGVKLFYNDFSTTGRSKRECIYNLCNDLKEKGLIDGIGMQGYWSISSPSLSEIKEAIERFAELGLEIQLTEWSINAPVEDETGFAVQAERYASVFRLLQKLDTQGGGKADITCVSFFGVQDHYILSGGSDKTNSRIFDKDFNPKPVYFALADTFKNFY